MSQINTNINSLIAQRVLSANNKALTTSLERLSTGYRINRGGDDPAGLIISEQLRAEKNAISSAIGNAERADQIANIAESGLQEITNLLTELQSLVGSVANDAGISDEEKDANQLQVDAILSSIDRIASTTEFNGTKLLNGRLDFLVSGVDSSNVIDFAVNGAKVPAGSNVDVNVVVTQSAQHAGVFLSAADTALNFGGAPTSSFVFEVTGTKGTRQFSFASGVNLTDMAASINGFKSITGVSAAVSGDGIVFKTDEFGSSQFVSVKIINDAGQGGGLYTLSSTDENTANTASAAAFTSVAASNGVRDEGQDIGASVNGLAGAGRGTQLTIRNDALDVQMTIEDTTAQTLGAFTAGTIYGGGAKFNLGPDVSIGNQVTLGIRNVAARNLGNNDVGYLSYLGSGQDNNLIDGDLTGAQEIITEAINQIAGLRGRIGSFQKNVVGSTITSLNISYENVSAAESAIRDTDFAEETANLTRNQILVAAATSALQIANANPQNVLSLLG